MHNLLLIINSMWYQPYNPEFNYKFMLYTYFILVAFVSGLLIFISFFLSNQSQFDKEKLSEYECGFEPFDHATRQPFDIHYYVVALLFLIFDIEVVLFFPWSGTLQELSIFSHVQWSIFIFCLTIAFFYEWHRGVLRWTDFFQAKLKKKIKLSSDSILSNFYFFIIADWNSSFSYLASFLNYPDYFVNLNLTLVLYSIEIGFFFLLCLFLFIICRAFFKPRSSIVHKKKTSFFLWFLLLFSFLEFIFLYQSFFFSLFSSFSEFFSSFGSTYYATFDLYTMFGKEMLLIISCIVLLASINYLHKNRRHLLEYSLIFLLTILFLCLIISANNLLTILFGIMGFSLNIYILLITDNDNASCRESAIKYFYLSAISAGFLCGGIILIYYIFHSLNYQDIVYTLNIWIIQNNFILYSFIIKIMIISLIISALFKLALFPCHFWSPDVYAGSPYIITFLLMVPIKLILFLFFVKLLIYTLNDLNFLWHYILFMVGSCSTIYGAIWAYGENDIKRFWSYSSINQIGITILGLTSGTYEGISAVLLFLFIYVFTSILYFIWIISMEFVFIKSKTIYFSDIINQNNINPVFTFILAVIFFSMAGIPPLAGFFGKLFILTALYESKMFFSMIIIIITSLWSAYYYLRIIKISLFDKYKLGITKSIVLYIKPRFGLILICIIFIIILIFFVFIFPIIPQYTELLSSIIIWPKTIGFII